MAEGKKIGKRTRKILEDFAERIIPSGGPDYPGARDIGLVNRLIERFSSIPGAVWFLKLFAWNWEFQPVWYLRFKLFTWMSPEEQSKFLEGFEKSRFMFRRLAIMGSKALFMAGFYNQPVVWKKIGYEPGKCFRDVKEGS